MLHSCGVQDRASRQSWRRSGRKSGGSAWRFWCSAWPATLGGVLFRFPVSVLVARVLRSKHVPLRHPKDVVGEDLSGDVELLEPHSQSLRVSESQSLTLRVSDSPVRSRGPAWTLYLAWSSETGFSKSAGLRRGKSRIHENLGHFQARWHPTAKLCRL